MKRIELLFDTLRSPYDAANIIQIAESLGAVVYTSGINSIPLSHKKIQNKILSWNIKPGFKEIHYNTFSEAVDDLRSKGKYLIGTSVDSSNNFYDIKLPSDRDVVVVFGTETSGLTIQKQAMLDDMAKLPMDNSKMDFLTLPVVTSAVAYELYRRFLL